MDIPIYSAGEDSTFSFSQFSYVVIPKICTFVLLYLD